MLWHLVNIGVHDSTSSKLEPDFIELLSKVFVFNGLFTLLHTVFAQKKIDFLRSQPVCIVEDLLHLIKRNLEGELGI